MMLGVTLGNLGKCIGDKPKLSLSCVFSVLFLSSLVLYLKPLNQEFGFETGFTTPNSPSIAELRSQVEFFGNKGKPWYLALFARPSDPKGSVHIDPWFGSISSFYNKIKKTEIRFDNLKNKSITYLDLCDNTCHLNNLLFTTYNILQISFWEEFRYPITTILGYQANIGKHLYDVRTDEDGVIQQANLTMLVFMSFSDDEQVREDLFNFEMLAQKAVDENNANPKRMVDFVLHSELGMAEAVIDGMKSSFCYILFGFLLVIIFLFCVFLILFKLFDQYTFFRVFFMWLNSLSVFVFSLITSFGIYSFLGCTVSVLTPLIPIFAFLYAIDITILLSHTWLSDADLCRDSRGEHLREVFATCMPLIVMLTCMSFPLFLFSFYPIVHYANFSVFVGLIFVTTLFYLMFSFAPLMTIIAPAKSSAQIPRCISTASARENDCIFDQTKRKICNYFASSNVVRISAIIFLIILILPLYPGYTAINANLDYRQLLKKESPRNEGVRLMSDVVWPQYFSILFIIKSPPDFSNETQYSQFKSMIEEIEHIENKYPSYTDMTWINDFCQFTKTSPFDDALNMTAFLSFINDPVYEAWKDGVKFEVDKNGRPKITSMLHIVTFNGTETLSDKAKLFEKCRRIVSKYPQFVVFPFDTEIGFADVMVQIFGFLIGVPFAVYTGLAVAGLFILGNLSVGIINFIMHLLIFLTSFSIFTLLGNQLNPFNVAYWVIVISLIPKFTSHFCYFYQQAKRINSKAESVDRLNETMRKSLLPVLLSWLCSLLILLPSLIGPVEVFQEIAIINTIVTTIGLVFSFYFVQVCLNALPETWTGTHFLLSEKQDL